MSFGLLPGLAAVAFAGIGAAGRTLGKSESNKDRRPIDWRKELTGMLDAHLTSLDSLVYGFSRR